MPHLVDPRSPATQSVVLRYRSVIAGDATSAFGRCLERTSQREGARIVGLLRYRDVDVELLDETSLMRTGTLKSIDGCVTVAHCLVEGWEALVFESGGNTGTALTTYAAPLGLETFCFVPVDNLGLLDAATFASPRSHLIAVDDAARVKHAAAAFARDSGLPHVPRRAWRHEASQLRGCFILEHMTTHGRYDWLVQSVSAAFGPLGIYAALDAFDRDAPRPRLLGVQQAENCPLYRAWKGLPTPPEEGRAHSTRHLLTRVMYDATSRTYGTYDDVRRLLAAVRGDVVTVDRREFAAFVDAGDRGGAVLASLARHGIELEPGASDPTGLMALAGALKAIDDGIIATGSRVLCCLTSGAGRVGVAAEPERHVVADAEHV